MTPIDDTLSENDKTSWPAWYYGPKGASQIFYNAEEVPEGWEDHPSKVGGARKPKDNGNPQPSGESPYKDWDDAKVVAELKSREIEHHPRWPRVRLENALLEDDKAKAENK